jgi:DNA-binding SARP family transcriptional activator
MEFRILGPLEVVEDGQVLDVGGAKQRALLAVLLLHANEVVSTDRLIDALWEDSPPDRAQKALQVYVSGLRKLVGQKRIETRSPGYGLRVEADELDVQRCRRLIEEGRPGDALALWRGPPLAEFAYSRFAQPEIARLEELRLVALEDRIDADLAVGRHAALVGELEGLVQEHPLRERLRAQLMLALYRAGRQADALEAYQDARRALTEELGIEPGRDLRDLQQAILKQDPGLELAADGPSAEQPEPSREPVRTEVSVREARKTVTAVVAEFSPTADRLDAETLRHIAGRCFDEAKAIFERHGGSVEQSIGGTVSAVFGIPVIHEDDALRALRAGAEVQQRMSDLGEELETRWGVRVATRIGVSTGEVVTGGASRAIGGPVSTAAELQQAAEPDRVILDDATLRLVRGAVEVERVDGQILLVGVQPAVDQPGRLQSPMIGRERERRRLHDAFEQAVGDRACHLFTVLGLAGVGKSRLVEEFLGDLGGRAVVARGRCLPYGEGITFWPLMEAVKELAGLDDADTPDAAIARLVTALQGEQDAEQVARRVAEVIGLAEVAMGAEEGFAAVRALLEAFAREQPLVVVFDDIHWGESTFLDLVEHVADWTREAPILLVCLARPELLDARPGWAGGKLNATSILLEPLSEVESAELVENLAGKGLEESARRRIVEAAEGNPLFVEEMLALTLEEGNHVGDLVVPPTIQALLAARLDRLDDDDRAVLERGAVQGKVFYEGAVVELSPEELRAEVTRCLGSLLHKELIRPERPSLGGRTYRFRHLLIRDAAYEAIPKEVRSGLHEHFGRWQESAAGERAVEYEEIVGYHLEQAYQYRVELEPTDDTARTLGREAAERLGSAGRRAFTRTDAPAGMNLISRAVSLLSPDDRLRVDLVPSLRVLQGWTDLSWADRVLTEAVEAAATSGDRRLAAHALVQRAFLRLFFTDSGVTTEELLDVARRAVAVFEEHGDEVGLARAWRLRAQAHYLGRRAGACAEASEVALAHARRAADRFEAREIIEWLGVALFLGPIHAQEAARRCEQLLGEIAGDPSLEVNVLGALSYLVAIQGRKDEAEELLARGRGVMHELGEWIWLFPVHAAFYALWEDDPQAAERELLRGYDVLKKVGERSHFSSVAALLAQAAYAQGHYDEAERFTHECEETANPNDIDSQIRYRATRGKVLARRGETRAGEELVRQAVTLAQDSDFLPAHGDALMDLAEVLGLQGRQAEATAAIEAAVQLYEAKGNAVAANRARVRLEELSAY